MKRRLFLRNAAMTASVPAATTSIVASVRGDDENIITTDNIEATNSSFSEIGTKSGRKIYNTGPLVTQPNMEAGITNTLGHYNSSFDSSYGWEHKQILTGGAVNIDTDNNEGFNTFDGLKMRSRFHHDQYDNLRGSDDWFIDFTTHKRGIYPFDGGGDQLNLDNIELGADIAIPTLIGIVNAPAGAVAAVTLAADDFIENLEPSEGEKTIDSGGIQYFKKNDYFSPSEDHIAYSQRFQVIHESGTAGIEFKTKARTWDRTHNYFPYSMEVDSHIWVEIFPNGEPSTDSNGTTDTSLETTDPAKMSKSQREEYGIFRVDPSAQDLVAERLNTRGDRVEWTIPNSSKHIRYKPKPSTPENEDGSDRGAGRLDT